MTVILIEGFDRFAQNGLSLASGNGDLWTRSGTIAGEYVTAGQRNGLGGFAITGTQATAGGFLTRAFVSPITDGIIGFAYKLQALTNTTRSPIGAGFRLSSGGRVIVGYEQNGTRLQLWINGALIHTTVANYPYTVYYFQEISFNASTGDYTWRINNTIEISGSIGALGTTIAGVQISNSSAAGGYTGDVFIDDMYARSGAGFLGDSVVTTLFPNANGALQQWTPTPAGSAFERVNNSPPDPAQYVETSTINDVSDFNLPNPAGPIVNVHAVAVDYVAVRTAAGVETAASRLTVGGTTAAGATNVIPQTTPQGFFDVYNLNPNTGTPWTSASVNGLIVGIRKVS